MSNNTPLVDINDLIFQYKNQEYGAFVLRKLYSKFLTYATVVAIIVFTLALSAPIIVSMLTPTKVVEKKIRKAVTLADLGEPESIDKKKVEEVKVEEIKSVKSTVAFLPPVIKPDDKVTEEYMPTIDELKAVDPGAKTQVGDPGGVDLSLIEVQDKEQVVEKEEARPEIFTYVEEMPSFPGGEDALMSFINANIQYPEIAKRAGVEGKIFVKFVVGKEGRVSDVNIIKGIGAGCDEEAVRVIRQMPHWNPGKQNGRPVHVQVSIPIVFRLQ